MNKETNFDLFETIKVNTIHIRIQQRNGKKNITLIEGSFNENFNNWLKEFKKMFGCSGNFEENNSIIKLSGDQRQKFKTFLINKGHPKEQILIHGF